MQLNEIHSLRKSMMSISSLKNCALLLLLFACTTCAAWASTLEGTVLDPSGRPVPAARISLLRSLTVIDERQTDSTGAYKFEGLREGIYTLAASARGLSCPTIDIEISKDKDRRQDINLALSAIESQVIVSASLGGMLAPQIGSSVSLISKQDIEDRSAQNALEVIRGTPGIEVSQNGNRGGVTGVYIRGGESRYNAVMVDGIPINEFGGGFDMASLPADGIERMEITRGPQSALYGANAVTGAINIISRRGEGPPSFTALAEGGSNHTYRIATGGSGLTKGLSWSYNLSRLDSEGVVANDDYRNQSAFLALGFNQARRQFSFRFFGNANDSGNPGPYGSDPAGTSVGVYVDEVSRGKQNLFGYQAGYTEQFSSRWRQVTAVNLFTNDIFSHSMYGDYNSESLRGILNTRSEINLSTKDTLAAGFEFNREQTRNNYVTDNQFSPFLLPRTSLAYFVENRWSPTNRFYLVAGIRMDHIQTHSMPPDWGPRPFIPESTIIKASPRTSATYLARDGDPDSPFGGTRIHGSFGTGIRPPDAFELAFTDNPQLKPEQSISFDAGVEQSLFSNRAVVDFTYFFNRFDDQIVTVGGSMQDLSSYTSDNLKNSRAQGFEVSFQVNPIQFLELAGQYSFVDATILALDGSSSANSPYEVGDPLLRRPRHSASYSITYRYKRLTLSTNAYIRGATLDTEPAYGYPFYRNKGYTRADMGVSYKLPYGMEMYGRLNNFLNQKYEELLGYPALRLNFMAGMRFAFPSE
jgi:outer membrane cobalamin receptor